MEFEIVGRITDVRVIAAGKSVRESRRLRKFYRGKRWRKMKGIAQIRLADGTIHTAELHWYEAHGIGKKETKIKRILF
ncbi:MAG: hypothetical protein LAO20_03640 [Acidobacteriia bacterium]|nr:hypothetical protein [Terriglobia bacterium]